MIDRLEVLYAESERSRVVDTGDVQYGTGLAIPENGRAFRGVTGSDVSTEGEYEFDLKCGPSTRGDSGRDCLKGKWKLFRLSSDGGRRIDLPVGRECMAGGTVGALSEAAVRGREADIDCERDEMGYGTVGTSDRQFIVALEPSCSSDFSLCIGPGRTASWEVLAFSSPPHSARGTRLAEVARLMNISADRRSGESLSDCSCLTELALWFP